MDLIIGKIRRMFMKLIVCFFAIIFFQISWAKDEGVLTTQNFSDVVLLAKNINQNISSKDVLIVFDLDNTLIKFAFDFGSEHWFMWQKELITNGAKDLPAVTNSVENLLTVQSWIYQQFPMEAVDYLQVPWIREMQMSGAAIIALTSRSFSTLEPTLREIERNNIYFSKSSQLGLSNNRLIYFPYDHLHPEQSGLSSQDISDFKLGPANYVTFDQGVYLTQGQNKGIMLKTLLYKMQRKFKAIIFIDDRLTHIETMKKMANNISEKVYSIHFNKSELWTKPFFDGGKEKEQGEWCKFSEWLNLSYFRNAEGKNYRDCLLW